MGALPVATGNDVIGALLRAGFTLSHVRGSHHCLRKPGATKLVVVPVHGKRDLPKGTLRSILRQAGMTADELAALLLRAVLGSSRSRRQQDEARCRAHLPHESERSSRTSLRAVSMVNVPTTIGWTWKVEALIADGLPVPEPR